MPYFVNPFKKHDVSEFPGVLIPLQQAAHRNTTVAFRRGSTASVAQSKHDEKDDSDTASRVTIGLTIDQLKAEVEADLAPHELQSSYDRKSKVINKAIQDIGMGRYQWQLFVLCGFGWLADNLWLQGVALTLTQLSLEFGVSGTNIRYTTLALFLGLCLGASFWGIASDVIGRRLAFNTTLFLAGVFGLAAGGGPNWIGTAALFACLGLGVGGNLPVDGALFLEFLPFASGNLLTLLSVWWPVGQLISSLIAWGFIPNYSCTAAPCPKSENMGWRYFILTLGALTFCMFICRFFFFHLFESPKFLLSRGRQSEAVAVVHGIAYHNKSQTWLTEDILNAIGGDPEIVTDAKLSTIDIVKRSLGKFSTQRIGPLFSNKKLGITTCLLWFQWTTIGMGYPLFNAFLPQYLANSNSDQPTAANIVYRNYAIASVVGVPGSIIACYTVDIKYVGRKGTMAIATLISGIFIFCFTISGDPNFQLAFTCLEALFQNVMYGVLYAYTPEVFPAPNRGTGTGISSFLNRVAGLCAPIVAVNAGNANPKAPIYAAGGLFLAAFVSMLALPIETMGKQSL
ncbi:major facilitator superfamily domain-containing protein [Lophiotrema nucula]|uniref:Major facilitator superfamily domain-containing protein n=1 Tax=Lophiotrema nucula TaxID=690887 RepID=A0A6A5YMD7_9PLEO|nr:major facilitator superfamily domain-containing protein [Lophiotrema nucula]